MTSYSDISGKYPTPLHQNILSLPNKDWAWLPTASNKSMNQMVGTSCMGAYYVLNTYYVTK